MRRLILLALSIACLATFAEEERITAPYKGKKKEAANEEPKKASEEDKSTWDKVKEGASDAAEAGQEGLQKAKASLAAARERRANSEWTITGNYSLFETWTLNKYGFTIGYNKSESTTYELEYMRGSFGFGYLGIDLASITEQRISLLWRTYGKRNSFSMHTGIFYYDFSAGYGNDYLSSVAGGYVEAYELKSLGLTWGLGNRWQSKGGFVWGFDWFAIHMPLVILEENNPYVNATTDAQDREDAEDAANYFRRFPMFAVVKVQLGFSW